MLIKFLKAYNGDSIWLRYKFNEVYKNILIDGGTGRCYSYKDAKNRFVDGDLKKAIQTISDSGEKVDLLIATHVDDDHIGGLIKWFELDAKATEKINEVWFNSSLLFKDLFVSTEKYINEIQLNIGKSLNTSIRQGSSLEKTIDEANIWKKELIHQGQEIIFDGLTFQILSPEIDGLKKLNFKWAKESARLTSAKKNDYSKSIKEHIKDDTFTEDDSLFNESSIAFILTIGNNRMLFLSDAHPSVIKRGLSHFNYNEENPAELIFVKLSHHGSKKNLSAELLKCIKTSNFIVSSNGEKHNLPDKQCLSRIIGSCNNVSILFNYPDSITRIFSEEDNISYKFNASSVETGFKINDNE